MNIVQYYSQSLSHQHFKFSLLDTDDSLLLAKGGSDGYIAIYDIGTGECKSYLQGHSAPVGDVIVSSHPFHKSKLLLLSCSGTRQFHSTILKEGGESESGSESEVEEVSEERSIKLT